MSNEYFNYEPHGDEWRVFQHLVSDDGSQPDKNWVATAETESVAELIATCLNSQLNSPSQPDQPPTDPRVVASDAEDAFWAHVANSYPMADSGDLGPENVIRLSEAAQDAVREWYANNVVPKLPDAE